MLDCMYARLLVKAIRCILIFLAAGNGIAYAQSNQAPLESEKIINVRKDFALSDAEKKLLQEQALDGSPEAALKLGRYFLSTNPLSEDGFYWMSIAVENGSIEAIYSLGAALRYADDIRSRRRAIYWLKRAIKECPEPLSSYARDALKEIGE